MKKISLAPAFSFVLLLSVLLGACSGGENADTTTPAGQKPLFTIEFIDGTEVVHTEKLQEGELPTFDYSADEKEDDEFIYLFAGWALSPEAAKEGKVLEEMPRVTADAKYYASYTATEKKHEIKNKVILLAGQSNMEGHDAMLTDLSADVRKDYLSGHDNVLIYFDCTYVKNYSGGAANTSGGAFVPVKFGQAKTKSNLGPEVGLAKYLGENDPDTYYYLIKSCEGSSSLSVHWSGNGSCLKTFLEDVDAALEVLKAQEIEFEIVGMLWAQGESDAGDGANSATYKKLTEKLIDTVSTRYADYISEKGFSWIDSGISNSYWKNPGIINSAKKAVVDSNPMYRYVSASETLPKVNNYHYTAESYLKLGEEFGKAVIDVQK